MTIQVGMIGNDGIVLASDTRWTHPPELKPNQFWAGIQYGSDSTKMKISHERGIAISCALDLEMAGHIAHDIIRDLKDDDSENPIAAIEEIAGQILTQEKIKAQCIVALTRPFLQLFMFQFANVNGQWGPFCQEIQTKTIAGDNVNSAIFWMERYYDKSLPVDQLIPLAAHLVVCAGNLNPYCIGGLEIVRCDASGIHPLPREENRERESAAKNLDKKIGELILGAAPSRESEIWV